MITAVSTRETLRRWIPDTYREGFYRGVSALVAALAAVGYVNANQAALWTQMGVGVVTCLFALLYTTSGVRSILYVVVGPLGGLLMSYGIARGVDWAIVIPAVGQIFGITTAAAKTIEAGRDVPPSQTAA